MRLRYVQGSRETIEESIHCFETPKDMKGRWHTHFGNKNPIHLEIGMGKGRFIMELARRNPQINYIGIEKFSSVLVRALEKQELLLLPNLCFIRMDAEDLTACFDPGEVEGIYLNFSDPWPKDRHAKRRLTSPQFLQRYSQIAGPDAQIEFKTDNTTLFEFSVESAIQDKDWEILVQTDDLHEDPVLSQDNIMTEYEERFSMMGNPIHKMILKCKAH